MKINNLLLKVDLIKGHGTGNDFILMLDTYNKIFLNPDLIISICNRYKGIGADGFIRAVKTSNIKGLKGVNEEKDLWFMDYYNADGKKAEICGNGIRVFVHFLVYSNQITFRENKNIFINTRAGIKSIRMIKKNLYSVKFNDWFFNYPDKVYKNNFDSYVTIPNTNFKNQPAISVNVGNPHTVVLVNDFNTLSKLNLNYTPVVNPRPLYGSNIEFAVLNKNTKNLNNNIFVRVHERGVGETQSCGTGACASAIVQNFFLMKDNNILKFNNIVKVNLPGGKLVVKFIKKTELEMIGKSELINKIKYL